MKLGDAILLGSTILTPCAGRMYSSETQSGCALGMAAVAKAEGEKLKGEDYEIEKTRLEVQSYTNRVAGVARQ